MGLNLSGFATSIKTSDLSEIAKVLNIKISEQLGKFAFEEAISGFIEDDDIYITETRNGSIITVGMNFPIFETVMCPLSENENKLLRFIIGETSMIFFLEYHENGRTLRRKVVQDYDVVDEEGKTLEIEYSGEDIDEVIMQLIQHITGDDIYSLEPEHLSIKYKYLGKIEKTEISIQDKEKSQLNHKANIKPWWKFWKIILKK
jgi:hypothetical protein